MCPLAFTRLLFIRVSSRSVMRCRQFMIGDSVLVSPVLQQGADTVLAYFPANTTWHCLWGTGQVIEAGCVEPHREER